MLGLFLCGQLMAAAVAADSNYASAGLRALVARAAVENRRPPPEFRSYSSRIETEVSLILRDSLGREHTSEVEQFASAARWTRSGRYDLHVIGYRSQSVGVPYSTLTIVRGWTVPSLYGNRLSLGAYFSRDKQRTDTLRGVHPFADDREQYYRFTGGDTIAILRAGSRAIPIARIHVHPAFRGPSRLGAFEGEIDLDADRAQIVRMRGRFVTIGGEPTLKGRVLQAATGATAAAFVEFVNGEVDGKFWLPVFQRTEFQASLALLGQVRPVFRLVSNIRGIEVDSRGDGEADSTWTPRVAISWAPSDSVNRFADWQRGLGTQSGAVHSDDFDDIGPDVWRSDGAPRFTMFPTDMNRMVRFNRVEGLFTGFAPNVEFRNLVPGLRAGAHAGWAWSEQTVRGGAFVSYQRANATYGIRAERTLARTNDFTLPLSEDHGLAALLGSVDNADYVDRRRAMFSVTRVLRAVDVGLATIQIGMADDRGERARLTRGVFTVAEPFRFNRGAAEGRYVIGSADLELRPGVTGDFVQPGIGLRLHYTGAAGDLDWQRTEVSLSARKYLGRVSVAAHADGGIVWATRPPPQQLFELGGSALLTGYEYKQFAGDRAALFRAFATYRFDAWKRPIRLGRSLHLPALNPGLAVSAQGGWAELSSAGARAAVRQFGLVNGEPVSGPTNGMRATIGGGITIFSDIVHLGLARPVDRPAKWRFVGGFGMLF